MAAENRFKWLLLCSRRAVNLCVAGGSHYIALSFFAAQQCKKNSSLRIRFVLLQLHHGYTPSGALKQIILQDTYFVGGLIL